MSTPSPYRFTVSVERYQPYEDIDDVEWYVNIDQTRTPRPPIYFNSEAEARSHAALVLAALHQAEMEET